MRRIGAVLVCAAVVLGGCDEEPDDPDAGIILRDSGTTPGTDAGGTCGPRQAPLPSGTGATGVCLQSTFNCLLAATTAAAQQTCLDADPNGDACEACLIGEQLSTATSNGGCAPQYGSLLCCIEAQGCAATDTACQNSAVMGPCATQASAFNQCVMSCSTARTCGVSMLCVSTTDGGTPDPDAGTDDDAGTASDAGTDDDAGGGTADAGVDAGSST